MNEGNRTTSAWQDAALGHLAALYSYAMTLTRNPIEAEDLVQETYVQAVSHFADLKPNSNLKAWLFTILRNTWLKQLRHQRSGPDFIALDDHYDHQADSSDDPQTLTIRIWERDEIRQALKQLPKHCSEIIVLRDIEGMGYREIAEILDCPIGTIMSRLARARAKLKNVLYRRRNVILEKKELVR